MAAVIRLARFGKRHYPTYRVVVTDHRKARDGQFLEQLGFYNPNLKTPEVRFEYERVMHWLGVGAQPSDTVRSLLKQQGIMALFHEKRAGRSIDGKTPIPLALKPKKSKPNRKAKARMEAADKAAAAAPAEA
jgi:small subunit ribosomal protein S16